MNKKMKRIIRQIDDCLDILFEGINFDKYWDDEL